MTLGPRPHFKRLYLTPDMAVSNQNMCIQCIQTCTKRGGGCIDVCFDVCVTAVWQQTDRFTNYFTFTVVVPPLPCAWLDPAWGTEMECTLWVLVGLFSGAPPVWSPKCVFTHWERCGALKHSVSESVCNGADAVLISPRSWMRWACLRSDVFVFQILPWNCKHTYAVYLAAGFSPPTTSTHIMLDYKKPNVDFFCALTWS